LRCFQSEHTLLEFSRSIPDFPAKHRTTTVFVNQFANVGKHFRVYVTDLRPDLRPFLLTYNRIDVIIMTAMRTKVGRRTIADEKRVPIPFMVTPTELEALDTLAAAHKWNRNILIRDAMEKAYPQIFKKVTK